MTKGVDLFPPSWRYVIQEVLKAFPGAILAGGALRDLNADISLSQIKDLDFFIPFEVSDDEVESLMNGRYYRVSHRVRASYFGGASDEAISHSVTFKDTLFDDVDVNFIWMAGGHRPIDRLKLYDFGACQIAWDGRNLHTTRAFGHDMKHKTFTLVRSDNHEQFARSIERFGRISVRYPGWRMVVSDEIAAAFDAAG